MIVPYFCDYIIQWWTNLEIDVTKMFHHKLHFIVYIKSFRALTLKWDLAMIACVKVCSRFKKNNRYIKK